MKDFEALRSTMFDFYRAQKYPEAIELIKKHQAQFPEYQKLTTYWLICLNSVLNNKTEVIESFTNALSKGMWFPDGGFDEDSDFVTLRKSKEFIQLRKKNNQIRKMAIRNITPKIIKIPELSHSEFKAVCLHGNGCNADMEVDKWKHLNLLGYDVILPNAPEPGFSDGAFLWSDEELSKRYLEKILKQNIYKNTTKVIVSGFSRGARIGLLLGLKYGFKVDGIISFAPGPLHDLEEWDFLKNRRNIPIVIIIGAKDSLYADVKSLYLKLKDCGHRVLIIEEESFGHEFPNHFHDILAKAINFIENK